MFALFAVCLLHLRPSRFTRLLLFTCRLPSLHLSFFFFLVLSQYLLSLFSPLCSRSAASLWDFPSDTCGDAGSRRLAILIGRPWPPVLPSQQPTSPSLSFVPSSPLVPFSSPTSHKDFTFSSPVFLASFLPFFSPLSSSLQCPHSPVIPFYFHLPFFSLPHLHFTSLPLFLSPSLLFLLFLPFLISSAMTSCVFIFPFNSCLCSRARLLTSSSLVSFFLPLFFSTLSTARRVAL